MQELSARAGSKNTKQNYDHFYLNLIKQRMG